MAPAAATAAARLSGAAAETAPRRTPHVAPATPPEIEPIVIRREQQIRIRRGRIADSGGVLRPRDRRWSGESPARQATDRIDGAGAAAPGMSSPAIGGRVELPRFELPEFDLRRVFQRPERLAVPKPAAVANVVRTAPDHPFTGFLVASRWWIGIVSALAAGLVFIQVQTLHINSGIGTDVQKISALQRQNADLRTAVSGLSSDQRIVSEAERMGFVEPPVGSTRFAAFRSGDSVRAVSALAGRVANGALGDVSSGSQGQGSGAGGDYGQGDTSAALADSGASGQNPASNSLTAPSDQGTATTAAVPDGGTMPQTG